LRFCFKARVGLFSVNGETLKVALGTFSLSRPVRFTASKSSGMARSSRWTFILARDSYRRICAGKDDGRRLQIRAESQQTAVAILHHEPPLAPWRVAKSPSEFYALGGVLSIQCVGIFNGQVRVEQFVRVFVRIGGGRRGTRVRALLGARKGEKSGLNHLLVARHDGPLYGIDRRILLRDCADIHVPRHAKPSLPV
jgi:hypothetical protein